jgi:hypothetical protein
MQWTIGDRLNIKLFIGNCRHLCQFIKYIDARLC